MDINQIEKFIGTRLHLVAVGTDAASLIAFKLCLTAVYIMSPFVLVTVGFKSSVGSASHSSELIDMADSVLAAASFVGRAGMASAHISSLVGCTGRSPADVGAYWSGSSCLNQQWAIPATQLN